MISDEASQAYLPGPGCPPYENEPATSYISRGDDDAIAREPLPRDEGFDYIPPPSESERRRAETRRRAEAGLVVKHCSPLSMTVFGGGKHGQFKAWEVRFRPHVGDAARACHKWAGQWRRVRVVGVEWHLGDTRSTTMTSAGGILDDDDAHSGGGGDVGGVSGGGGGITGGVSGDGSLRRHCFRSYVVEHLDAPKGFSLSENDESTSEPEFEADAVAVSRVLALQGAREHGVGTHLLPREATDASKFRAGDAVELRERPELPVEQEADLEGSAATPVVPFVWMSRVGGAFADVEKDGPSALLKAADPSLKPACSSSTSSNVVERMHLPGTLVVAKIEGRDVPCRVRQCVSDPDGGVLFDLRQDPGNDVYDGVPACDLSLECCVRAACDVPPLYSDVDKRREWADDDQLREFRSIDARRALGLILDEDCVVTALTADSPFAPVTRKTNDATDGAPQKRLCGGSRWRLVCIDRPKLISIESRAHLMSVLAEIRGTPCVTSHQPQSGRRASDEQSLSFPSSLFAQQFVSLTFMRVAPRALHSDEVASAVRTFEPGAVMQCLSPRAQRPAPCVVTASSDDSSVTVRFDATGDERKLSRSNVFIKGDWAPYADFQISQRSLVLERSEVASTRAGRVRLGDDVCFGQLNWMRPERGRVTRVSSDDEWDADVRIDPYDGGSWIETRRNLKSRQLADMIGEEDLAVAAPTSDWRRGVVCSPVASPRPELVVRGPWRARAQCARGDAFRKRDIGESDDSAPNLGRRAYRPCRVARTSSSGYFLEVRVWASGLAQASCLSTRKSETGLYERLVGYTRVRPRGSNSQPPSSRSSQPSSLSFILIVSFSPPIAPIFSPLRCRRWPSSGTTPSVAIVQRWPTQSSANHSTRATARPSFSRGRLRATMRRAGLRASLRATRRASRRSTTMASAAP